MDNKHRILEEIEKAVPVFKPAGRNEYRINCPFCDDQKQHMYIKCSDDISEPLLYNCFFCNEHGMVNKKFLKMIGVDDEVAGLIGVQKVNKFSSYMDGKKPLEIFTGAYKPESLQAQYIEHRLGPGFDREDYNNFKVVWDMENISKLVDRRIRNILPSNQVSITFLSDDKTMLLSRGLRDDEPWRKLKIVENGNKSFYTIKSVIDLFADHITVNIAEGVFDILSAYKNFNTGENSMYVAVLGSDYASGIEYAVAKGLFGNTVDVKVYLDNDRPVVDLKRYKWLFKSIKLYRNIYEKDIGVVKSRIALEERRV